MTFRRLALPLLALALWALPAASAFAADEEAPSAGVLGAEAESDDPKEREAALKALKAMAGRKDPAACYELARLDQGNKEAIGPEALRLYRQAADGGVMLAQLKLAIASYTGQGLARNVPEAIAQFKRMVKLPDGGMAYHMLAQVYQDAPEVRDPATSLSWLQQGAEAKELECEEDLADWYMKGKGGVKADPELAAKWTLRAAEDGSPHAMLIAGLAYDQGFPELAIKPDAPKSLHWLEKAAEDSVTGAQAHYLIARKYSDGRGVERNPKEALRHMKLALDQGYALAMVSMGYWYSEGINVAIDYKEALRLTRLAAFMGEEMAMSNMGDAYEHGHGVKADLVEAYAWDLRAGTSDPGFEEDRKRLRARLTPAQLAAAEARSKHVLDESEAPKEAR